jgi:hypothetical protein
MRETAMDTDRQRRRRRMTRIYGDLYEGEWRVISGENSMPSDRVRIRHAEGDEFVLEYLSGEVWQPLQTLVYMPDTETLENRVDENGGCLPDEPERCISFWNRVVRNRAPKCAIYAMRVGENPPGLPGLPAWETGSNGSWGAEEG